MGLAQLVQFFTALVFGNVNTVAGAMVRICLKVFGLRGEVSEATFRQEFILECFIKPRRKHENRRAGVVRGSVRLMESA